MTSLLKKITKKLNKFRSSNETIYEWNFTVRETIHEINPLGKDNPVSTNLTQRVRQQSASFSLRSQKTLSFKNNSLKKLFTCYLSSGHVPGNFDHSVEFFWSKHRKSFSMKIQQQLSKEKSLRRKTSQAFSSVYVECSFDKHPKKISTKSLKILDQFPIKRPIQYFSKKKMFSAKIILEM